MINNNFSKSNCPNFQNEYELFQKQKQKLRYTSFLMKIQITVGMYHGKNLLERKNRDGTSSTIISKTQNKNNNTWA